MPEPDSYAYESLDDENPGIFYAPITPGDFGSVTGIPMQYLKNSTRNAEETQLNLESSCDNIINNPGFKVGYNVFLNVLYPIWDIFLILLRVLGFLIICFLFPVWVSIFVVGLVVFLSTGCCCCFCCGRNIPKNCTGDNPCMNWCNTSVCP